ncbi:7734_t:CDS:2, partial [Gigaspora margarita]
MTKQFNNFFEENYIRNLQFDSFETDITVLSSNSYKLVSKIYNNNVVLSKISFSNKYTIKDFINDLRQYRKVELHENIIKFIGIIKQSTHGIMFIHEYANKGTLRQYLDQNFYMLNWNDKFNLAKQLVSAIKCLHENAIPGTPKKYVKIYKEINNINYNYEEIITESIKDKEYREKPISKMENSNQTNLLQHYIDLRYEIIKELEIISSITTTLNKILVEDSSVNCTSFTLNLYENVLEKVPKRSSLIITNQFYDYDLQKFLFDLNHLFISQFNIQGISEITSSSIVQCLRNFIDDNNKCPFKILEQYYNHQLRICFTGIIGFFYEYGIGTSVDYCKAFDMYKKAAEEFYFANNDSLNKSNYFFNTDDLLKENQIIGLISL